MNPRSLARAGRIVLGDPRSVLPHFAAIVGVLAVLTASASAALTRYAEDFEGPAVGANFHGWPAGAGVWSVAGLVAGDQAGVSSTTAAAGAKALFLSDSGTGRPRAALNLVNASLVPTALTKGVITFSVREDPNDAGAGDSFTVNLGAMTISHARNTSSFYFSVTGGEGKTVAYTPGAWTEISVAFDNAAKTAAVTVNGTAAGTIAGPTADFSVSSMTFGTYSSGETGSAVYFDRIVVEDPAGPYLTSKIRNGAFPDASAPWKLGTKNSAVAILSVDAGWGRVDIQSLPTSPVHNANVTLEQTLKENLTAGTPCTISFTARAEATKTLDAFLYDATNTIVWQQWSIPVGTAPTSVSYTFTPTTAVAGPRLVIRLGATNADVWFDNLAVNRGTTLLIANGAFGGVTEPWTASWQNGATGSLTVEANAARVDIQSLPTPARGNATVRQALEDILFKDVAYTLSFTARAEAPKVIDALLRDANNAVVWAQYGIAIGTETSPHFIACTLPADCDGGSLVFQVGGENADITLDAISLAGGERLRWAPPTLVNPTTLTLGTSDPVPILAAGTDYLIKLPPTPRISQVKIQGGRHVVVIGGHVQITAAGGTAFYIRGGDPGRIVHIEGVEIDSDLLAEGDAFAIDGSLQGAQDPDIIVQVENVRVERLYGTQGTIHADVIQPWGGVKELRVDRLSGRSNYQGLFLKADWRHNEKFVLRNIDLKPQTDGAPGTLLWLDTGLDDAAAAVKDRPNVPVPTRLINVSIQPSPGKLLQGMVYPATTNSGDPNATTPTTADGFLTWPSASWVTGGVSLGGAGDEFVPVGAAGLNYVSPGYH